MRLVRRSIAPALLVILSMATLMAGSAPADATRALEDAALAAADRDPLEPWRDTLEPRRDVPEDVYAMAGGCYVLRTADGYVRAGADGSRADADLAGATAFHFEPFDLAKYLLRADAGFLGAANPPIPYIETGARLAEDLVEGLAVEATDALVEYIDAVVADNGGPALGLDADAVADPLTDGLVQGAAALDDVLAPVRYAARGDAVMAVDAPSAATEWVLRDGEGEGFTFNLAADDLAEDDQGPLDPEVVAAIGVADGTLALVEDPAEAVALTPELAPADACPVWEEVEVNVTGDPLVADSPVEAAEGYLDAHLHMMAFEFIGGRARCGRPWHPYGVAYALVDCPDHEPGGQGAILEHVLSGTDPVTGHDTVGWPTFGYWPNHHSLTHEQVYYRWMERAWRAGLRMFTNLMVDNGALCDLYPLKQNSCNEMDGVRLQILRLHELERYIDAQNGGPGEGWFRIVTDPFEAREVINSGRLAVVMGIEVSVLFDCGEYLGVPRCDAADLEAQLQTFYDAGIRQMELVNKFDNALSGVTGDGGTTGLITNAGNRWETGHFLQMETCTDPESTGHDHTQMNVVDGYEGYGVPPEIAGRDALAGGILATVGATGAVPVYPEGPHCNNAGLSELGHELLDEMVDYGMIFDPDHMSALARHEALDHLGDLGYRGIVSSHGWADDTVYPRILEVGGVVTPYAGGAGGFVEAWRQHRDWANPEFFFGFGYGADTNGFGGQGGPVADAVSYPFTGLGGVQVDRQVSGEKTYDYAEHGTAHYGLYADWIEAIVTLAGEDGPALRTDMVNGVEAYLQTWERAVGIAPDSCATGTPVTAEARESIGAGDTAVDVLRALGQPAERTAEGFTFCAADGPVTIPLNAEGRVPGWTGPLGRICTLSPEECGAAPAAE